jgi:hypothetical protein
MTEENEEPKGAKENLKAVGQIIVGELETIGGILTADPISQAEGELAVEAGTVHLESSEALADAGETEKSNETD